LIFDRDLELLKTYDKQLIKHVIKVAGNLSVVMSLPENVTALRYHKAKPEQITEPPHKSVKQKEK
jgi:hypothetical protein